MAVDTLKMKRKYKDMRNSLLEFSSKEFLVFLFFLAVSATFWFLSTLNDTYEKECSLRIEMTDIPKNIVITEALPDTVRVTLRDKGFNLLEYYFGDELRTIHLRFSQYAKPKGKGSITQNDIQRILKGRLLGTTSITSVKADKWDFYYSYGSMKKVPIIVEGQLLPATNYYITRTVMTPDSASVYASNEALDTIKAVYTVPQNMVGIKESTTHNVELQPITGARIEPATVTMSLIAEQMTEVTVNVPVKPINVPEGKMLKTFPARVDVKVTVGLARVAQMKPELFNVVADYDDLPTDSNEKIKIKIITQPRGIVRAHLKISAVDYVLETF